MSSLTEALLQQITTSGGIEQIAAKLGVDPATAQQGVAMGLPLLMAALARNAASPQGAEDLTGALQRDHDGSVLKDIPAAVNNYNQLSGNGILGHVLGNQREPIEKTVSQNTGIDAGKLLEILAPLVMGALGSQQHQQGLDPQGVAGELAKERQQIAKQEQSSPLMQILTMLLDRNQDGSVLDDVGRMIAEMMASRGQQKQP